MGQARVAAESRIHLCKGHQFDVASNRLAFCHDSTLLDSAQAGYTSAITNVTVSSTLSTDFCFATDSRLMGKFLVLIIFWQGYSQPYGLCPCFGCFLLPASTKITWESQSASDWKIHLRSNSAIFHCLCTFDLFQANKALYWILHWLTNDIRKSDLWFKLKHWKQEAIINISNCCLRMAQHWSKLHHFELRRKERLTICR